VTISDFVKVTNEEKHSPTKDTFYGTIRINDGVTYVQLDGSELLTPCATSVDVEDGERVMVTVGGHEAIVTGNLSSPAARGEDLRRFEETTQGWQMEWDKLFETQNANVKKYTKYISFDEGDVIIGRTDSDNKMELTNESCTIGDEKNRNFLVNTNGAEFRNGDVILAHMGYDQTHDDKGNIATLPFYSFGTNSKTYVPGGYSFATGRDVEASGMCSHAEGGNTTASGRHSHAEGWYTTASGGTSHAEGHQTTASGGTSHAEGGNTTASGLYSHAEGYYSTARGNMSHAEGHQTTAKGLRSHAEGSNTIASGRYSHAGGYYTEAAGDYQTVIGKYNTVDSDKVFIIGGGSSDNARKNILQVDWDGNVSAPGGANFSENSEFGKNLNVGNRLTVNEQIYSPNMPTGTGSALYLTSAGFIKKSSSSKRYKKHVSFMEADDVEKLYLLRPVYFKYKEGLIDKNEEDYNSEIPGFYAELVGKYFPEAVIHNGKGQIEDWDPRKLIPGMLKLIQLQKGQLDRQEERLSKIESILNIKEN
jgi:hypothetical protein